MVGAIISLSFIFALSNSKLLKELYIIRPRLHKVEPPNFNIKGKKNIPTEGDSED